MPIAIHRTVIEATCHFLEIVLTILALVGHRHIKSIDFMRQQNKQNQGLTTTSLNLKKNRTCSIFSVFFSFFLVSCVVRPHR